MKVISKGGNTAVAASKNARDYVGIELNPDYVQIAEKRISESVRQMELSV